MNNTLAKPRVTPAPSIDVRAEDRTEISFKFREQRDGSLIIVADVKTTRPRGRFVSRAFDVARVDEVLSGHPKIKMMMPMYAATFELMLEAVGKFLVGEDFGVEQKCAACGCSEDDCRRCIKRTGKPCHWIGRALCSACGAEGGAA